MIDIQISQNGFLTQKKSRNKIRTRKLINLNYGKIFKLKSNPIEIRDETLNLLETFKGVMVVILNKLKSY